MKKEDYTIDRMIELFAAHTVKVKKNREQIIKNWNESDPPEQILEFNRDDFYISEALLAICKEIRSLKKNIEQKENKNEF